MDFQYYLPVNLLFGRGKIDLLGSKAREYGTKALIVTGKNSTKKTGLLDKSISLLAKEGVTSIVFDEVEPNPLTTTAEHGAALAREQGCDLIIGLGGGSIMDAAKGIAFLAENDGDINDYIFGRLQSDKALPSILVPTTCGTGSEGNCFAVLSNPVTNDKKSLRCNAIIAKLSIVDPDLMMTMPRSILASVGFDALCHNMEAYLSRSAQPITDMFALEGIRLLGENLLSVYENYDDTEGWEKVALASTFGGMVINTAGVTAAHGIEHPASGLRNIVHGGGLSAITPVVYERSISQAPEKFARISQLLGGQDEHDCVARLRLLIQKLGLPSTLSEQGIKAEDIPWMAENCMKVSVPNLGNNPQLFEESDVREIYEAAL
ncbi:MAG: iron-containing alcohol dehydrogenase [Lachnospiraceae bacterium]